MDNDNTSVQTETTSGLVDSLLTQPTEQEAVQDEPEQQETTAQEEQSPEEARKAELNAGLNELLEDGWTVEELQALVLDDQIRKDINAGKSLMRAVNAYERRQRKSQSTPAPAKHGAPSLRSATTAGSGQRNTIADMSDEEFNKYYEKTKSEALAGKKIRL